MGSIFPYPMSEHDFCASQTHLTSPKSIPQFGVTQGGCKGMCLQDSDANRTVSWLDWPQ